MRLASSANHSTNDAAYRISPRASASGLPCSEVMISARSSALAIIRSNQARSSLARSWLLRRCHTACACAEAVIADSTSAPLRLATRARISPVAGLVTANERPPDASCHPEANQARVSSSEGSRRRSWSAAEAWVS